MIKFLTLTCVDHHKLWKIFKETDHLTCLLRKLYAGQEATVRTRHETDRFKIGKGILSGATLGITDKMEARPQPPLLIPQTRSWDEGVRSCDSDLFFPFFG